MRIANAPQQVMPDTSGKSRSHTQVICDNCGEKFWKPSKALGRRLKDYCSRECSYEARKTRVNLECDWCGTDYSIPPSKLNNSKHGYHFCSRECKDTAQRIGGIEEIQPPHYSNNSHNYRAIVIREERLTQCERCGYDEHVEILQVHHKDRDRTNNQLDNLEVLCPNCHSIEHRLGTEV